MAREPRFSGKTALISGSARGMGEAFARAMYREEANVIISDVEEERGAAVAAGLGARAIFVRLDVTSLTDWREAVSKGEAAFGPISVLCNNAGIFDGGPIQEFSEERYRRVIDVNQLGVFLGMQAVVPSMQRAGGGAIVNISSGAGMTGYAGACAYTASKWAVRGMTKVAALELGACNIRVNSIHPGMIETDMAAGFKGQLVQPIPRLGRVDEVAELMMFLASEASSYCTGSEFVIDGGGLAGAPMPDLD